MKTPTSRKPHRVPRSRRDDFLQKGWPLPSKMPGIGTVESIQDDTITVTLLGEDLAGVIPLMNPPPGVGQIVEVESRGDLLVALNTCVETPPEDIPYADLVLASSPLAYYRLNESSGAETLIDSSGHSRDGQVVFGTMGVPGLIPDGTAFSIGPTNSYARTFFASWMEVPTFTAEAVIKPTGVSGTQDIVDRYSGVASSSAFWLRLVGSDLVMSVFSGGVAYAATSSGGVSAGSIHHVAGTFNGSTVTAYLDGVAVASASASVVVNTSPADIHIGQVAGGGGYQFTGVIDEVAYYSGALSAATIAAHHAAVT